MGGRTDGGASRGSQGRCPTCHRRLLHGAACPADGATPALVHVDPIVAPAETPVTLGELMGAGGFGAVWSVAGAAERVIKIGHRAASAPRFRREADALSAVGPPAVPELHAAGALGDGRPYLIMEHIGGGSVAALIAAAQEPVAAPRVIALGRACADALAAAHARGVVHRDVKPENLLLRTDAALAIALVDFGLARALSGADATDLTSTGVVLGTPHYSAPEQLESRSAVGPPADVYALGVVLYELATGCVPFVGDLATVERGHRLLRPVPPTHRAAMPAELERLILACLAKMPEARPAAAEVAAELAAMRGVQVEAARTSAAAGAIAETVGAPVPIVAAEAVGSAAEVSALAARHGGFVAWQGDGLLTFVVPPDQVLDPAAATLSLARALTEVASRVAVHVAPVRVRRRADGRWSARGAAVSGPGAWMPAGRWQGVRATASAARALVGRCDLRAGADGSFDVVSGSSGATDHGRTPMIGQQVALARLEEATRVAFDGAAPTLVEVRGERGAGTSRLLFEAARIARRIVPAVRLVRIDASPTRSDLAAELAARLGASAVPSDHLATVRMLTEVVQASSVARATAIIIDDAAWAGDAVLDALDAACAARDGRRLLVVLGGGPGLRTARPALGRGACAHHELALGPLVEADAMALGAELLRPVEYPPAEVLRRLAAWSGGLPGQLRDAIAALRADGVVRRRAGGWYLATGALDQLPASPVQVWLLERALAQLPAEVAALARCVAVLGERVDPAAVTALQTRLDATGGPALTADAHAAIAELVRAGVVAGGARGELRFRGAMRDALYAQLHPDDRRALHRCALELAEQGGDLDRVALHARGCGDDAAAVAADAALGARALAAHRYVEADHRFSAALATAPSHAEAAAWLRQRARARYRMDRLEEALADLDAAHAAIVAADPAGAADLDLDAAIVLDWMGRFDEATTRAARATEAPAARRAVARGRALLRREQVAEAVEVLEAARGGDAETELIRLLLLGPALVLVDRVDEAAECFERALAACDACGDPFHRAAALSNRVILWEARRQPERGFDDLRTAIAAARELGASMLEAGAACNLAELLFWSGDDDESLTMARRARALEEGVLGNPAATERLLEARVLAARGELEPAAAALASIELLDSPMSELVARALWGYLAAAGAAPPERAIADWGELGATARDLLPDEERAEVAYWCARTAAARGDPTEARAIASRAAAELGPDGVARGRLESLARYLLT